MPGGEAAAPPPSAANIAWNWVIEELADCKEFDSSILAALLRWDRGIIADPVFGGRTMERLVLKYVEEVADATHFLSPLPPPKSAAFAPDPVSKVLDREIGVAPSKALEQSLAKVGGSNSTGNCIDESCKNDLCQVILQKRAALPRSSLDLLKDLILEDCRQGASFSSKFSCLVKGDERSSLLTNNSDDHGIASKKLKVNDTNIQQVKLLSAISNEGNQNSLPEKATSISKGDAQIGIHENNASSRKQNNVPEFLVEKNKKLQISPERKTGNGIQFRACSSDSGQMVFSESSSDEEGYYDAFPDFHPSDEILAAEKLKFLNSQNTVNNGSQLGDWTQQKACIKCDKSGEVLICTGSGCPIAIHESCLGSFTNIENPEDFKCPFCSYLLAASAYYEARKKVSIARKNLHSFMGWGHIGPKKGQPPSLVKESDHARKTGNLTGKVCVNQRSEVIEEPERENQAKSGIDGKEGNLHAGGGHSFMDRSKDAAPHLGEKEIVNEYHVVRKSQHQGQAAATISDCRVQHRALLHKEKNQPRSHCHFSGMATHHLAGEHKSAVIDKLCLANSGASKVKETDKGASYLETEDSEPFDRSCSLERAQRLKHQRQTGTDSDPISLPCQEIHVECEKVRKQGPAIEHDADEQKSCSTHSGEHSSSNNGRKHRISTRRCRRYKNPLFPYARRKVLPWTCEEEAFLKEAMKKLYQSSEENISWVKIWEIGQHIFHKTRHPSDLKDKWRNIRKREG